MFVQRLNNKWKTTRTIIFYEYIDLQKEKIKGGNTNTEPSKEIDSSYL